MKSYTLKELVLMREEASDRIKAANLLPSDETTAALAVEKRRFYCESDVQALVAELSEIARLQPLEAENARLRKALGIIADLGYADGLNCKVIARNALKED